MQQETLRYDALIIGSSLGGLASGAMLAAKGYKVAVIDTVTQPGGRMGGTKQNGYWLSWGQRDGLGSTDLAFIPARIHEAAEIAGVELKFEPLSRSIMRLHWLPEQTTSEMPAHLVAPDNNDPMVVIRRMVHRFGGIEDEQEAERVAQELSRVLGDLGDMTMEQAWALVPVRLDDWLIRNRIDPLVRHIILQQAECNPFTPAEETSLGRYILHMKTFRGMAILPADDEVGAMQGVIQPWWRRLQELQVDTYLGWKPIEITSHDGQVTGAVAVNDGSLVKVFEAPIVITDRPGWMLDELVEERLLPRAFMQLARATRDYATETASWWAGLTRLPTIRATGKQEDLAAPWERMLSGNSRVKRFLGGFFYPSAFSPATAPPGKHLLCAETVGNSNQPGRHWRNWQDAKGRIDQVVDYLFDYYSDLEDCIEWSSYQYTDPPSIITWYSRPVYRHPVKVETIEGLYVASATAEGTGAWIDIEAASALEAVSLAEFERGHLRQSD